MPAHDADASTPRDEDASALPATPAHEPGNGSFGAWEDLAAWEGLVARIDSREAEVRQLADELRLVDEERDDFAHLLIAATGSPLGKAALRWRAFSQRHRRLSSLVMRPLESTWRLLTLRRPGWLRVNPLFDADYYLDRNPDVSGGRRRAWQHYYRHGAQEGRAPAAWFDGEWYLSQNPDVARGRLNPLDHYFLFGWREGRDPSPDFDGFDYQRHHPECVALGMNPLLHSLRHGAGTSKASAIAGNGWLGPAHPLGRLLGHYRDHGLGATIERVRDKTVEFKERPAVAAASVSSMARKVLPGAILAYVDSPGEASVEASATMTVAGWAAAAAGIDRIDIFVDGERSARTIPSMPRPDVGDAHPDLPGSATSGFAVDVPVQALEAGEHELRVEVRDKRGGLSILERTFQRTTAETLYHRYYMRSLPGPRDSDAYHRFGWTATDPPRVELHIPVRDDEQSWATVVSVAEQAYPAWSATLEVSGAIEGFRAGLVRRVGPRAAGRFTLVETDPLDGCGDAGTYHAFMQPGEVLAPHAIVRFAMAAAEARPRVLYSDRDTIETTGRHTQPILSPDWSPDYLLVRDYPGGVYLAQGGDLLRDALAEVDRTGPAWRYDLLLRLTDEPTPLGHVPAVLWSRLAGLAEPPAAASLEVTAVAAALERRGARAVLEHDAEGSERRVRWSREGDPKVSIVIPTAGKIEYLKPFLDSLLGTTTYPSYEFLFLDNSRGQHPEGIDYIRSLGLRAVERDEPYNWAKLNNDGARLTDGELLLFMNDDMEVTDPSWLDELVDQAVRPDVGAVGALLLYPSGGIQHAGIFLVGHGGGAMHWFHGADPSQETYLGLHRVARELSAVTGACMMVRRDRFDEVGGFDEDFPIVGNDTEFCLRLAARGYRTIWTPACRLIHHENVSRGHYDIRDDEKRMWTRHGHLLRAGDPYYSPNLTQLRTDCGVAWERVRDLPDPPPGDPGLGANLIGYARAEMGQGEATRGTANALHAADIPFVIIDYSYGNPARQSDYTWLHRFAVEPWFDVNILQINADHLLGALRRLPEGLSEGRFNIGLWAWELPEFPEIWRSSLDVLDEVWAPSMFVREAVAGAAAIPVHRVPHAVTVPGGPFRGREHFGLPADAYQFVTMYDTHSVVERKNPMGAIEAFCSAFEPDDDSASLVIKVNNADPDDLRTLRAAISGRANVHVIDEVLPRSDVDSLLWCSDSFVSLHRSEGFGLVIAEAMALGRPVIATNWSGNVDFMHPDNAVCIDYRLVRLTRDHGPYAAGQRWADPDLSEASGWMRRLRDEPALGHALGAEAARTVATELSPRAVGAIIEERLAAARSRTLPWAGRTRVPLRQ